MVSKSSRKEFRTSVILTETQFKQVRCSDDVHDVSMAWVLRQAVDRSPETQGMPLSKRSGVKKPKQR